MKKARGEGTESKDRGEGRAKLSKKRAPVLWSWGDGDVMQAERLLRSVRWRRVRVQGLLVARLSSTRGQLLGEKTVGMTLGW